MTRWANLPLLGPFAPRRLSEQLPPEDAAELREVDLIRKAQAMPLFAAPDTERRIVDNYLRRRGLL